MPIVQSFGALQAMGSPPPWQPANQSVALYGATQAYATIYATQPNVRTCVDFLARNIAQLGLHVFRRVSDTDRERLVDHDLARWMGRPNPATRRYRHFENLMGDLGIYFNAYWLKVRMPPIAGRMQLGLVRLPPHEMTVPGALLPSHFVWTRNGRAKEFPLTEIVHFDGYNPLNGLVGLSPLETLRRILAEEAAAGDHRESFWRNAARFEGVVERPATAPKWTQTQKDSWREQWQNKFGAGGAAVGQVAVLEDGMTFRPTAWSAKDSEYSAARKLTREECAAAYHIPLPMVGILEHATFSNIKEQHKHLYQDCLGPWLEMIHQEIEGQVLTECEDQADVYTEFNIADKLKGSFEEQASSLQALVGRPVMTANEGRARLNLPASSDPGADELAEQQGGPAAATAPPVDDPRAVDVTPVLQAVRARQQSRLNKLPVAERPAAFEAHTSRWTRELATNLLPLVGEAEARRLAIEAHAETLTRLQNEAGQ